MKGYFQISGFAVSHKIQTGVDDGAADTLSRVGHLLAVQTISTCQPDWIQEVLNSYATDTVASKLL